MSLDWRDHAACRGTDADVFFIERGESASAAKRICAGCSVRTECLEFALGSGEKVGIWGGLSEKERRRLRGIRRRGRAVDLDCGTVAGYERHRRHNETPCDRCREALRLARAKSRGRGDMSGVVAGTVVDGYAGQWRQQHREVGTG